MGKEITAERLEKAGYRNFNPDPSRIGCVGLWEKWVRDDAGRKLYAIHVYEWDMAKVLGPKARNHFEMDVQLRNSMGTFNVTLLHEDERTVEQMEQFVATVFERLWCLREGA